MDNSLRTTTPVPIRHHLVLGIGGWGELVATALARTVALTQPVLLPPTGWVLLSPKGLCRKTWQAGPDLRGVDLAEIAIASQAAPESGFLDANKVGEELSKVLADVAGQPDAAALHLHGLEPAHPGDSVIDILLVGRLDDPFAGGTLIELVDLVRTWVAKGSPLRFTINFLLGADSAGFPALVDNDRTALITFATSLRDFLLTEATSGSPGLASAVPALAGGVARPPEQQFGWCYLVDTSNEHAFTIARDATSELRLRRLAEVAAGFATQLLSSELREREEYARLALPRLRHDAALEPDIAYCSTFGYRALLFPSQHLHHIGLCAAAIALLDRFRAQQTPATSAATAAVEELFTRCRLDRRLVAQELLPDRQGALAPFIVNDALFVDVPDEVLTDRIMSWDAFAGRTHMMPLANRIEAAATAQHDAATTVLRTLVDQFVRSVPGGVATALEYCERASDALAREAEIAGSRPPQDRRGCLLAGFGTTVPRTSTIPTDLTFEQRALQTAIHRRVAPLAVWARYLALAAIESSFALAAWPYLYAALTATFGAAVVTPGWLSAGWLLPLIVLIANVVSAWRHRSQAERRFARARLALLRGIQRKYGAVLDALLETNIAGIYGQLQTRLSEQRVALEGWSVATAAAADHFRADIGDGAVPLLEGETALLGPERYSERTPRVSKDELDRLASVLLASVSWRHASGDAVIAHAHDLMEGAIANSRQSLTIEDYTAPLENEHALDTLVDRLQREALLQLHLGDHPTPTTRHFLGVRDRMMTSVLPQQVADLHRTFLISTADPSRLVFLPTAHALPLHALRIFRGLL